MKTTTPFLLLLFAVVGCADTGPDGTADTSPPPDMAGTNADEGSTDLSPPDAPVEATGDPADIPASSDASQLLATSLDIAKASDKRLLVHLGAPG